MTAVGALLSFGFLLVLLTIGYFSERAKKKQAKSRFQEINRRYQYRRHVYYYKPKFTLPKTRVTQSVTFEETLPIIQESKAA